MPIDCNIINMSQQTYKHILRLFSLAVVIIGVYQTYRFETAEIQARQVANNTTANASEANTTTSIYANSSYESGATILSTTQAEPFVRQSLTRRGLTPIIKSYALTGVQWAFNAALTYGHFVVAMYIYSAWKNPENPRGKKIKIVVIGLVILFSWLYLSPRIGYEKIKVVDRDGTELYHSEKADQKHRFQVFLNQNPNLFNLKAGEETTQKQKKVQGTVGDDIQQEAEYVQTRSDEDEEVPLPEIEA